MYEPKTICIFKTTTMKIAGNFRTSYHVTRIKRKIRKIRAHVIKYVKLKFHV
jgi:hypothetical protein